MNTFYITTPIYYVNSNPHIGHAYTTIVADCMTRFYKLLGRDSFMLTGTDEHGDKIAQAAAAKGKAPQEFVDEVAEKFKSAWEKLDLQYDRFIRTTDKEHIAAVQALPVAWRLPPAPWAGRRWRRPCARSPRASGFQSRA